MKNTKKLISSLYAVGAITGASILSGCVRTVYVYPEGNPSYYAPTPSYTPSYNGGSYNGGNSDAGEILGGILMGIGQAL